MRIFLLGDSFTNNKFQEEFERIINNKIIAENYNYDMLNQSIP